MGAFIARQPNGLLCRWSSVVDNITHYNMTDEDYIEYRAECARKEARLELRNSCLSDRSLRFLKNEMETWCFNVLS